MSTQPYDEPTPGPDGLTGRYNAILEAERLVWVAQHRKLQLLGAGGQGVVFLSERQGADGFTLPVALKVFSPRSYASTEDYDEDMRHIARAAARMARVQQDNLVDVHDFVAEDGIRIMEMEWLDGYDVGRLLTPRMLERTRQCVSPQHWEYINDVIVTAGPVQPRLKPGVAIQILRECLAGLAALHREEIVHGDLKPSNIMLKRTGNAKVIDIGSAIDLRAGNRRRFWSPTYAAPEVLEGAENSSTSDLASLGYVLVEMLAGQPPFPGATSIAELLEAKRQLPARLAELLPPEVRGSELLFNLCGRLISPDPAKRFSSAEGADLGRKGAAAFHRQLVKGNLASEYANDIRLWLEQLG
jgi:serine/threonine-protein kinase